MSVLKPIDGFMLSVAAGLAVLISLVTYFVLPHTEFHQDIRPSTSLAAGIIALAVLIPGMVLGTNSPDDAGSLTARIVTGWIVIATIACLLLGAAEAAHSHPFATHPAETLGALLEAGVLLGVGVLLGWSDEMGVSERQQLAATN